MANNTKIARFMLEKGITSKEVVKGAKISKPHVSMIVNGYQNITMKTLQKLCVFFNCTPNEILDYENWGKKG